MCGGGRRRPPPPLGRLPWRQAVEQGAPEVAAEYASSEAEAKALKQADAQQYVKRMQLVREVWRGESQQVTQVNVVFIGIMWQGGSTWG